jgi:hypothetical protein
VLLWWLVARLQFEHTTLRFGTNRFKGRLSIPLALMVKKGRLLLPDTKLRLPEGKAEL